MLIFITHTFVKNTNRRQPNRLPAIVLTETRARAGYGCGVGVGVGSCRNAARSFSIRGLTLNSVTAT